MFKIELESLNKTSILSEEVMKKILVLTNSGDGEHTDIVLGHLEAFGVEFFRLDTDLLAKGNTTLEMNGDSVSFLFSFFNGHSKIFSHEIGSVWYRRPNFFESSIKDEIQKKHAEKEIENLLEGLWRSVPNVFWLNKPTSLDFVRKKIPQLQIASLVGLSVPRTIVTNDPIKAKEFINSCNSGAIYKPINDGFFDYGDQQFVVQTTLITKGLVEKLDLIKVLPSLFQERVEKDYELRVTVVGENVFAVKINSQKFPETSLDWRQPNLIMSLDYELIKLPEVVIEGIFKMMKILDISFGAFDFAVDKNGNYWFFEVNGNGQWYWIEHKTDAPISKSIADILIRGTVINSSERR